MNKTTTFLMVVAIASFAGNALSAGLNTSASEVDATASARQSTPEQSGWFGHGKGKHKGIFEEIQVALDAKDFSAFQVATKETPLATKITTEEQFAQFVLMHTLREEGKTDEAKAIATELGFPEMKGEGMHGDPAMKEAVQNAIKTNDYAAFQTAIGEDTNSHLANIDTAEKFAKLIKMHSLLDEAKAIGEELGLPGPHGNRKMRKGGMGFGKMMR